MRIRRGIGLIVSLFLVSRLRAVLEHQANKSGHWANVPGARLGISGLPTPAKQPTNTRKGLCD
jgi:hypothetical protein